LDSRCSPRALLEEERLSNFDKIIRGDESSDFQSWQGEDVHRDRISQTLSALKYHMPLERLDETVEKVYKDTDVAPKGLSCHFQVSLPSSNVVLVYRFKVTKFTPKMKIAKQYQDSVVRPRGSPEYELVGMDINVPRDLYETDSTCSSLHDTMKRSSVVWNKHRRFEQLKRYLHVLKSQNEHPDVISTQKREQLLKAQLQSSLKTIQQARAYERGLERDIMGSMKAIEASEETHMAFKVAQNLPRGEHLEGRICDGLCRGKYPLVFAYDCFEGRHARSVCDVSVASHLLTRGTMSQRDLIRTALEPIDESKEAAELGRLRNEIDSSEKIVHDKHEGKCPLSSTLVTQKITTSTSVEYCEFDDIAECERCCGDGYCETVLVDLEEEEEEDTRSRCHQEHVLRSCFGGKSTVSESIPSFLEVSTMNCDQWKLATAPTGKVYFYGPNENTGKKESRWTLENCFCGPIADSSKWRKMNTPKNIAEMLKSLTANQVKCANELPEVVQEAVEVRSGGDVAVKVEHFDHCCGCSTTKEDSWQCYAQITLPSIGDDSLESECTKACASFSKSFTSSTSFGSCVKTFEFNRGSPCASNGVAVCYKCENIVLSLSLSLSHSHKTHSMLLRLCVHKQLLNTNITGTTTN